LGKHLEKPRIAKSVDSRNKPSQIKGKEEVVEIDQMENVVEKESKEIESKNNLDLFEMIVANLEAANDKSATNC
jgi:hypothetical protein